ncbi:nicotinate-nucleotide--dimethylbenzimidazole phosphoribosyltransferase [Chitinivorax sp. PXF-14]|uniref:nicotinate-nucleotide--dimethylbenzimidazole phosphoribosyltransferase n=1 Tax=Chitinivorax sp. PXF-14 TaxID=3230488 RepID=UPI0034654A51
MTDHWWQRAPRSLDQAARSAALARQQVLTKPAGALGELESLAVRLAAMQGRACPRLEAPWISIFAADHGVAAAGVSAYPQEVTAQMVANFATGGAAICVLAKQINARFEVVDCGVAADTSQWPAVVQAKRVHGTANFLSTAAMDEATLAAALDAGRAAVSRAVEAGADCFIAGEMGIANTTSASALACAWLAAPPAELAGPGTGLDASGVSRKAALIAKALALHGDVLDDTQRTLAALGGCEIAALAGAYVAAAQAGLPALVDGFISSVAALAACRLNPGTRDWLLFGHQSAEPAHARVLAALDARPLLQLGLRLGEGSGAAAAFPILKLACALHGEMATFAEAGVSNRDA